MVATVTGIGATRSVVSYFVEDGYYAVGDPEHRKASRWRGRGAAALGLAAMSRRSLRGDHECAYKDWLTGGLKTKDFDEGQLHSLPRP